MKKIMIVILIFGSILFGVIPCLAASEGNVLVGSDEADEIMQDIDLILESVRPEGIKQEDIEKDMNNIIRDYIDVDIFKNNIKTANEMREYLNRATYVYVLSVYTKKGDYTLTLSRGLPVREEAYLTEDEIADIEKKIDRWFVPEIGICEADQKEEDYDNKLKMDVFLSCYGIENSETFFVGGATTKSIITAICFTEEGEKEDDGPYYVALDEIDPSAQTKEEIEDAVFTFDEMKEYQKTRSGLTSTSLIIIAAAVIAVAVIVKAIWKHKKA